MTEDDDPHADLKRHRLTPEMAQLAAMLPRRTTAVRKRRHFVKVPSLWVERLAEARYIATYRLAHHLLYQHWKTNNPVVVLPNTVAGVSRWQKWRALRELERLGLVAIERRQHKSPRVTVLLPS